MQILSHPSAAICTALENQQHMVQVMGDWRSQVFTRYLYLSMDDRQSAQSLIMSSINDSVGYSVLPPEVLP